MTRFKAALTHLLISSLLAALVIGLILFGWYPLPLFWVIGGPMLIALIVGIDVVLGPLMTAILFNPKKSRLKLKLDLALIGIVQLSALSYGVYSGYVGRASYGAFHDGQFHLVYAGDLAPAFVAEAPLPQYRQVPWVGQQFVGVQVPDTAKAQDDVAFFKAIGAGPERFPKYFVPLDTQVTALRSASLSREQMQSHPALLTKIDALLTSQQLSWQDIAIIPFDLRSATYTVVLDLRTATVLRILPDDPRSHG